MTPVTIKTTISLPAELAKRVKAVKDLNVSGVCAAALEAELRRRERLAALADEFEDVELDVVQSTGSVVPVIFSGRCIVEASNGAAVYLTKRQRIAVIVPQPTTGPLVYEIEDYDTLDQAAKRNDQFLIAEAAAVLGEHRPVRLDI